MKSHVTITRNGMSATLVCHDWANTVGTVGYALKKLVKPEHADMLLRDGLAETDPSCWFAGHDWTIHVHNGEEPPVTHALTPQPTNTTVVTDPTKGDES